MRLATVDKAAILSLQWKGSVPLQMLKKGMGEAVWREKEILALDYLKERLPELPTELMSDAWLGVK